MPGEMSLQVASPIRPARIMFNVKYPVPEPISSDRG